MDNPLMIKKIAGTAALSLLLHVVFSSVGSDFDLSLIYWLLYCIGCGLIINYENISAHWWRIALLAMPAPIVLIGATYYRALYKGLDGCYLSGVECALDERFVIKSALFLFASFFFIWMFSYHCRMGAYVSK